jgi:hypothetical protein
MRMTGSGSLSVVAGVVGKVHMMRQDFDLLEPCEYMVENQGQQRQRQQQRYHQDAVLVYSMLIYYTCVV